MHELQRALGLEFPIVQAPMAGVQDHALAVAVTDAGGLGSLPCAMLDALALRREVTALGSRPGRPFNLNYFCHVPPLPDAAREAAWRAALAPYYREFGLDIDAISAGPGRLPLDAAAAELIEEFRPAVVSFHFGLPEATLLARVRATGARIFASATTIEEARWLDARGVDAVIAQGLEAGGHRGHFLSDDLSWQAGTFALLPQIVSAVRAPVIAAGGIADAAGVAAAISLGAALVQLGTAYMLCPEATTTVMHRAALAGDASHRTALTRLFTGRPARGIVNRLMRDLNDADPAPAFPLATNAIAPLRKAAEARGSGDFSPLWSGQNTSGCRTVPAAELTRGLFDA